MFHETSNRAGFQNLHEDDSDFESDDDDNDKNNPLKTNPISHQMMTTKIKGEKNTHKNNKRQHRHSSSKASSAFHLHTTNRPDDDSRQDILKAMLRRENDLRRAPHTQLAMQHAEASADSEWMDVVEDVQRQVVQEFKTSFPPSLLSPALTLNDLRQVAIRYPDIAHWVKHNRARRGKLKVGDTAPDVPLRYASTCEATTLLATMSSNKSCNASDDDGANEAEKGSKKSKPVVIAAGSLS